MSTPGSVDAAATTPMKAIGVPKLSAKGFKTGFFDIVELRIANAPITQSVKKNRCFEKNCVNSPPSEGLRAFVVS